MHALLIPSLAALAVPGHTPRQDPEPAFVELAAARESCYVGEVLDVRVRFGFARAFLAESAVQPFQQSLDVPARLELPWAGGLPCAEPLAPPAGAGPSFALGDELARAHGAAGEERGGRPFDVVELVRPFRATCAGELVFAGATLRYAFATRFAEDVFAGRVPADRVDAAVTSAPLALEVLPLPETGRPLDFTGAVGRFELRAAASETRVRAGEGFVLELTVTGEGDLHAFELPRFDLPGLSERGRIENRAAGARVVTLDLAAVDERVAEVPSLELPYFDPEAGEYRVARSDPVPLAVALAAERSAPPPADGEPAPRGAAAVVAVAIVGAFVALALAMRSRARAGT